MDLDLINITKVEFKNETRTCSIIPKSDSNWLIIQLWKQLNLITLSDADYKCFKPIMAAYAADKKQCKCNYACRYQSGEFLQPWKCLLNVHFREVSYDTSLSSSVWPSDQYWQDLAIEFGYTEDLKTEEGKAKAKAKIQKDNLKVDVYFKSLNVKLVNQTATYSVISCYSLTLSFIKSSFFFSLIHSFLLLEEH